MGFGTGNGKPDKKRTFVHLLRHALSLLAQDLLSTVSKSSEYVRGGIKNGKIDFTGEEGNSFTGELLPQALRAYD